MISNTPKCEIEFEFTLLLEGISEINEDIENALFESGCDDCTISMRFGRVYLTFSRSAASLKNAIISGICNVRDSQIQASVLRVDQSDLITQSEIARRIDRSRQLVGLYINGSRGPGGFPPPACNIADGAPLWQWSEVTHWLFENSLIKEDQHKDALVLSAINSVLEMERQTKIAPELTKYITQSLRER